MTTGTVGLAPSDAAAARFDLKDRVAVVTGGGSGLGYAIACALAEHGAHVAVVDRDKSAAEWTAQAVSARGRATCAVTADISRVEQLDTASHTIRSALGRVEILINSAGILYSSPAESFPDDAFDRVIDVNLKGTFYSCRAFGRLMLEQGSGSIINLASIGGLVGYPDSSAYQAAKGGVVQLTRGLAVEWINRGVRVNAIAPSIIETPMTRDGGILPGTAERAGHAKSSFILGRSLRGERSIGEPADVVGAAVFLASDAARLITGHTLPVDDGYVAA